MKKLFDTPVDASAVYAGFGLCAGINLRAINYDAGTDQGYIVQLVKEDGSTDGVVLGIPNAAPCEANASSDCAAYLTASVSLPVV